MKCKRIMSLLLALCLMLGVMVIPTLAAVGSWSDIGIVDSNNGVINAEVFYPATANSGNGHVTIRGVAGDSNGNGYIILAVDNASSAKPYESVRVQVGEQDPSTIPTVAELVKVDKITVHTNNYGNTEIQSYAKGGFIIVSIGSMSNLASTFILWADSPTGGEGGGGHAFDIGGTNGVKVEIDKKYAIEKKVNGEESYNALPGEKVTYTIEITNTGAYDIDNVYAYDDIPEYISIVDVNGDPVKTEDGRLLLDGPFNFVKGTTKTYTIHAVVSEVAPAVSIVNTASVERENMITEKDTATVIVDACFYVTHQATGKTDTIRLSDLADGKTFDITKPLTNTNNTKVYNGVTEGRLYGGLYTDDTFKTAIWNNICGVELQPQHCDHYYVKEVPDYYLRPMIYTVYDKNSTPANEIKQIYLLTAIDDANYQYIGFDVTSIGDYTKKVAVDDTVYNKFKVYKIYHWGEEAKFYREYTATSLYNAIAAGTDNIKNGEKIHTYNDGLVNCQKYIDYRQNSEWLTRYEYDMLPFFVTPDGVKVTGVVTRTVKTGDGHLSSYEEPGLTTVDHHAVPSTTSKYNAPASTLMSLSVYKITDEPKLPEIKGDVTLSLLNKKTGACEATIDLGGTEFSQVYFEYTYRGKTFTVAAEQLDGLYTASWTLNGLRNKDTVTVTACGVTKDGVEIRGEAVEYLFKGNRMVRQ